MAETQDLQRLIVSMEARTVQLERGLARASQVANRRAKEIETRFATMNNTLAAGFGRFRSVLGSLGIGLGLEQLARHVGAVVDRASELVDLSDRLGIPTSKLQELAFAAGQTGSDFATLADGLTFFVRAVGQARKGTGDLGKILKLNQVPLRNADGSWRSVSDLLMDYADLVKNAADETDQLTLTLAGVGRGGDELTGFLSQGSEGLKALAEQAHTAGIVIEDDLLKKAEAFGDRWDALMAQVVSATDGFLIKLAGGAEDAVSWLQEMQFEAHNFLVELTGIGNKYKTIADFQRALLSEGSDPNFKYDTRVRTIMVPGTTTVVVPPPDEVERLVDDLEKLKAAGGSVVVPPPGSVPAGGSSFENRFDPLGEGTPTTPGPTTKEVPTLIPTEVKETTKSVEELKGEIVDLRDNFEEVRNLSEDWLNTFADGLIEGKSLVESLADALEELGRSLLRSGIHMLVGSVFPTPATAAPFLGGAPRPFLGGIFHRAQGGPIDPGNVYKVHRDELIVPRSPGQVIPASRQRGGGDTINLGGINITIAGHADPAVMRQAQQQMLIAVEERLPNMLRKAHADRRI